MRKSVAIWALVPCFLLASCGGSDEKEIKDGVNIDTLDSGDNVEPEEFNSVLPSPVVVAEIFSSAGINFTNDLPNAPENADKYSTSAKKNLNFGVYTSDLAFCIVSEKTTEAKSFLKAISTLANGVGLGEVFSGGQMVERFEKNIGNQDSLTDIMIEIKDKVETYYVENGESHSTYIYFTGAWIEGMYLGAQSAVTGKNDKAGKAMAAQFYMLDDVIRGMEKVKAKTEDYNDLLSSLQDLKALFKSLETVKNLPEEQMYDAALKADEVKILAEKLIAIRTEIVKN
jgi:hypothetical protein